MTITTIFVDSDPLLKDCLDDLYPARQPRPTRLAVDLEGVDLCRYGRVSILQIWPYQSATIWLIDITTLGNRAFSFTNESGASLKHILETDSITKLFYDVRNDADALYHLHGISLSGICDLQILELAIRLSNGWKARYLNSLTRSIETYLNPGQGWKEVKERGQLLFVPDKGGSYEVFEQRPLNPELIEYCAQDVAKLFELESVLQSRYGIHGANWSRRIINESEVRLRAARSPYYGGQGKHRAIAPTI